MNDSAIARRSVENQPCLRLRYAVSPGPPTGLVTAPHAWHLVGHPWNVKGVNPTWYWSVPVTSASTLRPSSVPVLVVVALVLGVPVLVVQVVVVIAVLHCLVAAAFSVYMISMLVRAVLF